MKKDDAHDSSTREPARRRRIPWGRILAIAAIVIVLLIIGLLLTAWQASRHVPAYYEELLEVPAPTHAEAADKFEREVLELRNRVRHEGAWQTVVTEQQINGWLALTLPEKFPDALPPGFSEPRVKLTPGRVQAAVHYLEGNVDTVLSLDGSIFLTEGPNEVGLQIRGAQAGLLPLPLKQLLDEASRAANRSNLPLRWQQRDGDPVAILRIPAEDREFQGRRLRLEQVEIRAGELVLSGRMEPIR